MPEYIHDLRDNYGQINSISVITICIFIILWFILFLAVTFKMFYNRNENEYYDSVYYFMIGKSKNIFEDVLRKEVKKEYDIKFKDMQDEINELVQTRNESDDRYRQEIQSAEQSISIVEKNNEELLDELDIMNDQILDAQEYIQEKNEMNQSNIEKIKNMMKVRLKTFIVGMFHSLKVLNYQINNAYVTPMLANMISPLKGLYENVKKSLTDNEKLIKNTLPFEYDNSKLTDFESKFDKSDGPADLSAKFDNSDDFFMGYK